MPQRKYSADSAAELTATSCHSSTSSEYIPLSRKIAQHVATSDTPFFSVEFFPPKSKAAAVNLIARFDAFRALGPLFADITWHAAGNPEGECETSSITIAGCALNYCGLNTMLHITCIGMSRERLAGCLERAKAIGIRNILALRGDKNQSEKATDFTYAADLVRYIRKEYGDYFTIAVAGYPTTHPESASRASDLAFLKEKVDAGADFIITQLFFEVEVFARFVADCRALGITVPILPGVMPIQNYDSLEKIARVSGLVIPERILADIAPLKNNDEAVRAYGVEWTVELCRQLLAVPGLTPGIHFYTLNREQATVSIVKALGLGAVGCSSRRKVQKPLPWLPPANHRRCKETVRPIFWSSRPKSYVCRTKTWDEFPNGRWGHVDSPAFGNLNDYYLFLEPKKGREALLAMWGYELTAEADVWEVFHCYISGTANRYGHPVPAIPWNEEADLRSETSVILDRLSACNQAGILTINSQPNVNGAPSTDPVFGWGSEGGYVYQKAYVEFFLSRALTDQLLAVLEQYPNVNYQVVNRSGDHFVTNCSESEPIAVTWGVFPGKEIIQPTIVDIVSFQVWKDEAFSLWMDKWAAIYPEESASRAILKDITENYCLVNLVDNDYPRETVLWEVLEETLRRQKEQELQKEKQQQLQQ
ncbi:PREDICTED: methylenetetrahydrofolate reductase-like [Rhagoletis zephyria]|uniref:methylenetetrahydrofolate reductase-like n=1 Tax=Rhagoletis zephyria TaxID=28612 RepID=UPI0008115E29|nr:PREDICTED: methylenetetrahydrofolate reductase-like [Rhagoletis zephyria]